MNYTYSDLVGKIGYYAKHKEQGYSLPLAPELNKKIGNIIPGQYTVISGLQSSGTTSFVDVNYVMNPLLQWYQSDDRKPLKIFYFSMVDNEFKKLQTLLCSYLRLIENISVDIPTLNSQPGRKFDIDKTPQAMNAINDAKLFFDEVINEGALEIIGGSQSPSEITRTVVDFMNGIGVDKTGEPYELNDSNTDITVLVVVDKTDYLAPEADAFSQTRGNDLDVKFDHDIKRLTERYQVSPVIVVPANPGLIRTPKDTEPHYRQLGVYGKNCHRGIMLYNPIAENNINRFFTSADEAEYFVINGKNLLRYWYIVRNSEGIDSIKNRMLFLPGSTFMIEHDLSIKVDSEDEVSEVVLKTVSPYVQETDDDDDN